MRTSSRRAVTWTRSSSCIRLAMASNVTGTPGAKPKRAADRSSQLTARVSRSTLQVPAADASSARRSSDWARMRSMPSQAW